MNFRFLVSVAAIALLGACAKAASEAEDPHWGKQPCAHCAMLVSSRPYAAEGTRSNGQRLFFDDVGCLVAWERDHRESLVHAWAHDEGSAWIPVQSAQFKPGAPTPMDFGFAATTSGQGVPYGTVREKVLARLDSQDAERAQ